MPKLQAMQTLYNYSRKPKKSIILSKLLTFSGLHQKAKKEIHLCKSNCQIHLKGCVNEWVSKNRENHSHRHSKQPVLRNTKFLSKTNLYDIVVNTDLFGFATKEV